jgi:hypothetical protein
MGDNGSVRPKEVGNGAESWQNDDRLRLGQACPIDARQDADKFWEWLARVVG